MLPDYTELNSQPFFLQRAEGSLEFWAVTTIDRASNYSRTKGIRVLLKGKHPEPTLEIHFSLPHFEAKHGMKELFFFLK